MVMLAGGDEGQLTIRKKGEVHWFHEQSEVEYTNIPLDLRELAWFIEALVKRYNFLVGEQNERAAKVPGLEKVAEMGIGEQAE